MAIISNSDLSSFIMIRDIKCCDIEKGGGILNHVVKITLRNGGIFVVGSYEDEPAAKQKVIEIGNRITKFYSKKDVSKE